jgi:hypothetical protein
MALGDGSVGHGNRSCIVACALYAYRAINHIYLYSISKETCKLYTVNNSHPCESLHMTILRSRLGPRAEFNSDSRWGHLASDILQQGSLQP